MAPYAERGVAAFAHQLQTTENESQWPGAEAGGDARAQALARRRVVGLPHRTPLRSRVDGAPLAAAGWLGGAVAPIATAGAPVSPLPPVVGALPIPVTACIVTLPVQLLRSASAVAAVASCALPPLAVPAAVPFQARASEQEQASKSKQATAGKQEQ